MISNYWGRYVAFLHDVESDDVWIIRDPSGHMPCYRTRWSGILIYFSHLEDYVRLHLARLSINWEYLRARMVLFGLQSTETGLAEVEELQPGECDAIEKDQLSSTFYWHPYSLARENCIEDTTEAGRELRTVVKACVHHWAACYSSVLHRLSGGLDSAIVLGCLHDAPARPKITCVTYYPDQDEPGADDDERAYARAAAKESDCHLVEVPRTPTSRLEMMLGLGCFPTPMIFRGRNVEESALERHLAREHGATARFGGEGGDQIFFQAPIGATVGDHVWHRGIGASLFRFAWDVAQTEQSSVWSALKRGLEEGLGRARWTPNSQALRAAEFISTAVLETVTNTDSLLRRFSHPWFRSPAALPQGKLWQIYWLSACPKLHAPLDQEDDPERVEPLTSQPVLEACLRIPTFILASGGKERSLARRSFAREVPASILARRAKGSVEGFIRQTIFRNIRFVREMLLDGVLVKEQLLDRRRLESALSGHPERIASAPVSVFDFLAVEVWTRTWA